MLVFLLTLCFYIFSPKILFLSPQRRKLLVSLSESQAIDESKDTFGEKDQDWDAYRELEEDPEEHLLVLIFCFVFNIKSKRLQFQSPSQMLRTTSQFPQLYR